MIHELPLVNLAINPCHLACTQGPISPSTMTAMMEHMYTIVFILYDRSALFSMHVSKGLSLFKQAESSFQGGWCDKITAESYGEAQKNTLSF